ncbi:MAG TPA: AAA family ATPase [Candidatus Nitrosocosmicus sp.]|nr:AAA family ATPase [Candidatus Nitrosocosmicus sp.]
MELKSIRTKQSDIFELKKVNLLVGPNNSGKSQILRDIYSQMKGPDRITVILDKINSSDIKYPNSFDDVVTETITDATKDTKILNNPEIIDKKRILFYDSEIKKLNSFEITNIDLKNCKDGFENKKLDLFDQYFRKTRVLLLDASSRLDMAKSIPPVDTRQSNELPLLQAFSQQLTNQNKLEKIFQEAFNMSIKIDYLTPGTISFRVGKTDQLNNSLIPKDYKRAQKYLQKFQYLDEQGDGFRGFVGIVVSILSCRNRIILIDEPEAFLHSTQSKILGNWIAKESLRSNNQIIVATHSTAFVDSFSKFNQVNILRVERYDNRTQFSQLKADTINKFSQDAILSNLPMLDSIFYNGVVLCEGDRDRVVYRAAYNKKINQNEDILFINTNGKQGLKNVIPILKETRIRFTVITDFDLILNKKEFFELIKMLDMDYKITNIIIESRNAMDEVFFGESENKIVTSLSDQLLSYIDSIKGLENKSVKQFKNSINQIIGQSRTEQIKKNGLKAFNVTDRRRVRSLLNKCKTLGFYMAPYGEVENFIPLRQKKANWLSPALESISNNEIPAISINFLKAIDHSMKS